MNISDETFKSLKLIKLELLSLHGLLGITDETIDIISCNKELKTLDTMGCKNIQKNEKEYLITLFPKLSCFKYHF